MVSVSKNEEKMREYKVICVDGENEMTKPRVRAMRLSVPDEVVSHDSKAVRTWAMRLSWVSLGRNWSSSKIYLTEQDATEDRTIKAMFDSVDWQAVELSWFDTPKDAESALEYFNSVSQPIPSYEHLIAKDAACAFTYSCHNAKPFPEGEDSIAKSREFCVKYSKKHGIRLRQAEDMIAKDEDLSFEYGEVMRAKKLWGDWTESELIRSPAWLYQYAKDEIRGALPQTLHTAMMMFSFQDAKNFWVCKYLKAKKYQPKKERKVRVQNAS